MFNIFQIWADTESNMRSLMRSGEKMGEIATASNRVVEKRTRIMGEAMANPLNGDYAEIFRMVPEKVEAFSASNAAAVQGIMALNGVLFANWQAMVATSSGRLMPLAASTELLQRNMDILRGATRTIEHTIAPIHKTSTANARRLK